MAQGRAAIEVEGLRETLDALRQLGNKDVPLAIKTANKDAADTVAETARVEVPKRSGRLAKTIKALATAKRGTVKAGTASRVRYAGIIHFGGRTKGKFHGLIKPNPFLYRATDRRRDEIFAAYDKRVNEAVDNFEAS